MAAGVTQPGGAGTTIFIYDNASAPDTIAYHFADIAGAFPADFIDSCTTPKTYRSKVTLQVGDSTTGAAATTLSDTDVGVWFDTTKTLQYRTTQTTSWTTNLGTKVGAGNKASGRNGCTIYLGAAFTMRGQASLYGSQIVGNGAMTFQPATSGQNFEMIDCIIGKKGTASSALISIGTSIVALSNVYNVDIWGNLSSATLGLVIALNALASERCSIGVNACAYFVRSSQTTFAVKDLLLFGTPSLADLNCTAGAAVNWTLVNIGWSGNAPKFASMTQAAGNIVEYRIGDTVVGADVAGNPLAAQEVILTDSTGATSFDAITDSQGRVSFGSGLTMNAVPVLDHYGAASYLTRPRSPFLMNVVGKLRYNFNWPTDAVTGLFRDMADPIPLAYASGGPTGWTEMGI